MNSVMNNPQVAPCPIRMDTSVVALVITITITIIMNMNVNASVSMSVSTHSHTHKMIIIQYACDICMRLFPRKMK